MGTFNDPCLLPSFNDPRFSSQPGSERQCPGHQLSAFLGNPPGTEAEHAIKMMCLADLEFQHVEKTHTPYSEDFPDATSWSLYLCLTEDHRHLSSSRSLPPWDCAIPI